MRACGIWRGIEKYKIHMLVPGTIAEIVFFCVMLRTCMCHVQRILCLRRRVQIYTNNTTDVLLMKTMSSAKFNRVYFPFVFLLLLLLYAVIIIIIPLWEKSCYFLQTRHIFWRLDYFETLTRHFRWWCDKQFFETFHQNTHLEIHNNLWLWQSWITVPLCPSVCRWWCVSKMFSIWIHLN